ncbi:MAG TPA: CHAT domain-containing protein [Pyrinomonadaceae bacterium]|jgi:CHAT domain-containing protein/Tfp pilus assembly protein PilF
MPTSKLLRSLSVAFLLLSCSFLSPSGFSQSPSPDSAARTGVEELAAALLTARTEEEQRSQLAAKKNLLTVELRRALIAQGNELRERGQFTAALRAYGVANLVARELADESGIAYVVLNIGRAELMRDNYPAAISHLQQAAVAFEKLKDKDGMGQALNGLGLAHGMNGELNAGLEDYRMSLKLREEVGDKAGLALTLGNLSHLYLALGEVESAMETARKSLTLAQEMGDKFRAAWALNHLGNAQRLRNDYRAALESYQKGLKLMEELGGGDKSESLLNVIGRVYLAQGNYALARDYFRRSLAIRESLGDRNGMAMSLNTIGDSYLLEGDNDRALEYLGRSLALQETTAKINVAATLNLIGNVHLARQNYTQAEDYLQKSLVLSEATGEKIRVGDTLNSLARFYEAQSRYSQALEFAARALAVAEQTGTPEAIWQAHTTRGKAYRALGRSNEARREFDEAIAAIERLRAYITGGEVERQNFFTNKLAPYHAMIEMLIGEGKLDEALAFGERAKARVLLDVLRSGRNSINKSMTPQERERERQINAELFALNAQLRQEWSRPAPDSTRLASLRERLEKVRFELESFTTNLYATHPELRVQRGDVPPVTLAGLGELLPDARTILVQYVVTENRTYLFAITRHGRETASASRPEAQTIATATPTLKVYALDIRRSDLSDRINRFRQRLAQGDITFKREARALYDLLLKPARAELQGKTRLVIIPDDTLWGLPFQALRSTETRYVLEDQAISYAPSLGVLKEMTQARRRREGEPAVTNTLLALGNPSSVTNRSRAVGARPGETMPDDSELLPEAERQVRTLGQLYGAARSKIYTGVEASEERFKGEAGKYRILHLATHGVLDDVSPMYSYVLLATGKDEKGEDGLLEARELMNLELRTDLVVLSACETARGRYKAGEGVIGLAWALFVAGSPATLVSQWKVESASTTDLMLSFHRNLSSSAKQPTAPAAKLRASGNPPTKADALREAALSLLRSERYAHPFYWAGFVIIGDGN